METPLLNRHNVSNLLDSDDVVNEYILKALESFYIKYSRYEIVIQNDGDNLGIIIDAYNGEDNLDSEIFYFRDWLPF